MSDGSEKILDYAAASASTTRSPRPFIAIVSCVPAAATAAAYIGHQWEVLGRWELLAGVLFWIGWPSSLTGAIVFLHRYRKRAPGWNRLASFAKAVHILSLVFGLPLFLLLVAFVISSLF